MVNFTMITTPSTKQETAQEAADLLTAKGIVSHQMCPVNFSEWFECPCVRLPSGRMIFGIEGIRLFAERSD